MITDALSAEVTYVTTGNELWIHQRRP